MRRYISLVVLFVSPMILIGCSSEYTAVYQAVMAKSKWDETYSYIINGSDELPPPYQVIEGKLYLLIRQTQTKWLFHTTVIYPSWDKSETERLLQKNRALASMIPENWDNWLGTGFGEECRPGEAR